MDRSMLMAIVVAFLCLLLLLMVVGWRRRQKRQAGLPRPATPPADAGAELMTAEAFYVATTIAGEPLNRVAVAGLGYRARAVVTLAERGLTLRIPGQDSIFIPSDAIDTVEKATWTIDRVVETDGLVLVRWTLGQSGDGTQVDSYLRIIQPAVSQQFFETVQQLQHNPQTGGR